MGSLAEWSSLAGSYRGEMLGMLAVRVFLLAVEEYFQQHGKVGEGNRVSCDNKGALMTFDKTDKRIPAASSNAGVRRALRELDRLSSASYKLEHVKGHQDRNKKLKSQESGSQIECQVQRDGQASCTGISEAQNGAVEPNAAAGEMQCVRRRGKANTRSGGDDQANGGTGSCTGVLREQTCTERGHEE